MSYVPERGDIIWMSLDPSAGYEQRKRRPVLVTSIKRFNSKLGLCWIVPITSTTGKSAFETDLRDCKTKGVAMCHQLRSLDFRARKSEFIEAAPAEVVEQILAKLRAVIE